MQSDILGLLSADAGERLAALDAIVASAGPTQPPLTRWARIVEARPPDETELGRLLGQAQGTVTFRLRHAEIALAKGRLDPDELFPADLSYYGKRCGVDRVDLS